MSKYVPDILSHRWVIIAGKRLSRPDEFDGQEHKGCIFCPGNEHTTPGEVYRIGRGEKDSPGWEVRVIPNKYPITDFHEVIILSPDCDKDLSTLPLKQVELVLKAYRERYNFYRKKGQVIIFTNSGEHAGASITHPHSQLVVIPSQINLDTLSREPLDNVVEKTADFTVYCPDFSQWPYEVWIAAQTEDTVFGDITDKQLPDLAQLLQKTLHRVAMIYKKHGISHLPLGYNFYIHPKENWYIRIIPRFIHRAGFELGTGLSVNIVDPAIASADYRGEDHQVETVMNRLKKHLK